MSRTIRTHRKPMAISLHKKILFGYVILVFDRARIREIEKEGTEIRSVRRDINAVHRRITELATLGESVMAWDTTEYSLYHEKRMSVDTLLADLKQNCTGFVLPEQMDTLRMLLSDKEHHLHRMYPVWEQLSIANELEEYSAVLHDDEANEADIRRHTEAVIDRIHGLAAEAGRMLGRR